MIPNDLMIIQGEGGKKIRAFEAPSGVTYQLVLRPQMGAIGNIFTVIALNGPRKGESFALKEYSPAGTTSPAGGSWTAPAGSCSG